MYTLMTPGPTMVRENVRQARSLVVGNPDIDPDFYDFYRDTCRLMSDLLHTKDETLILGGEGILALEAACASLTEPGDRVLVLDNGVFGRGFEDFVRLYGGTPVLYTVPSDRPIDPEALKKFLDKDHDFKYATVVHCETPSGVLNDLHALCTLLKSYDIMTVADSVSAMFAVDVSMENDQIDILCGGSQKVLSAPPGLSFVTLSPLAKETIRNRKTPVASFYANLQPFFTYYEDQWFPYTMPISDITGLRQAAENIKAEPCIQQRHATLAKATRAAVQAAGLTLYPVCAYSPTVTAVVIPQETTSKALLGAVREQHNILLAGSFGCFSGKLFRIGHMGENAYKEPLQASMRALDDVLPQLGVKVKESMEETFLANL